MENLLKRDNNSLLWKIVFLCQLSLSLLDIHRTFIGPKILLPTHPLIFSVFIFIRRIDGAGKKARRLRSKGCGRRFSGQEQENGKN